MNHKFCRESEFDWNFRKSRQRRQSRQWSRMLEPSAATICWTLHSVTSVHRTRNLLGVSLLEWVYVVALLLIGSYWIQDPEPGRIRDWGAVCALCCCNTQDQFVTGLLHAHSAVLPAVSKIPRSPCDQYISCVMSTCVCADCSVL